MVFFGKTRITRTRCEVADAATVRDECTCDRELTKLETLELRDNNLGAKAGFSSHLP